jgi:hypothetical protein
MGKEIKMDRVYSKTNQNSGNGGGGDGGGGENEVI